MNTRSRLFLGIVLLGGVILGLAGSVLADDFPAAFAMGDEWAVSTEPESSAAVECSRPIKASKYDTGGTLTSLKKYVYNKNGQLTKANNFDADDTTKADSYVKYAYNSKGQLTKLSFYTGKETSILVNYASLKYNTKGQITKVQIYVPGPSGNELKFNGVVQYDGQGRLFKALVYDASDDSLEYTGTVSFDAQGKLKDLSIVDSVGTLIGRITFTYNKNGFITKDKASAFFFFEIPLYSSTFTYQKGACDGVITDAFVKWAVLTTYSGLLDYLKP